MYARSSWLGYFKTRTLQTSKIKTQRSNVTDSRWVCYSLIILYLDIIINVESPSDGHSENTKFRFITTFGFRGNKRKFLTQIVRLKSCSSRCRGDKSQMYTRRTILNFSDSKSEDVQLFLDHFVNGAFIHHSVTYNIIFLHCPLFPQKKKNK